MTDMPAILRFGQKTILTTFLVKFNKLLDESIPV